MRFTCYWSEILVLNTTFLFLGANLVLELDISLKKTLKAFKTPESFVSLIWVLVCQQRSVCESDHTNLVRK